MGNYKFIKNRVSGLCLGVQYADQHGAGGLAEVYYCNPSLPDRGHDNQWTIEYAEDGYYHIKNRVSGLCLGVQYADQHVAGGLAEVYYCYPGGNDWGYDNQWIIEDLGDILIYEIESVIYV